MRQTQLQSIEEKINSIMKHLEETNRTDKKWIITELKEMKRLHGFKN